MRQNLLRIRTAREEDAEALLAIYAPYILDTAITFETEIPSIEDFRARIRKTLEKYPYLVAEQGKKIVGYAYVSPFVGRAAYDWSVETSIYVAMDCRKGGVGGALYHALEHVLTQMNILNLNACIGYPKEEDEHLNYNSVQFHHHFGYEMAGHFHDSGYKFGRWYDMVWMEKMIGVHTDDPKPIRSYWDLNDSEKEKCGIESR